MKRLLYFLLAIITSLSLRSEAIDVSRIDSFQNLNTSIHIFLDSPSFETPENLHIDSFIRYERLTLQEQFFPLHSKRIWLKIQLENTSDRQETFHLYFGHLDRILMYEQQSEELKLKDKKGLSFKNYQKNPTLSSFFVPIELAAQSTTTLIAHISPSHFYYYEPHLDVHLIKPGHEPKFTQEHFYPAGLGRMIIFVGVVTLFISICFFFSYFVFKQFNLIAFSCIGLTNLLILAKELEYFYTEPIFWGLGDDLLNKSIFLIKALIIISIYLFVFTTFNFGKKFKALVISAILVSIALISIGILAWILIDPFIYSGQHSPLIYIIDGIGTSFNVYIGYLIWNQNGKNGKIFIASTLVYLFMGYSGNICLVFPELLGTYWSHQLPCLYGFVIFYSLMMYLLINNIILERKKILKEAIFAEEYKSIDKLKTQLYTNITHELRTPITVISGLSNHLKDGREKTLIQKNSVSLLNLVKKILDISQLENGTIQLEETNIELVNYLTSLIDSVSSLANEKNITIDFEGTQEKLDTHIDVEKTEMIFINVLTNAIKYTPEFGNIKTSLEKHDQNIIIRVSDNGVGIDPNELPKIFDRYYKINPSTRLSSGIGLSLVKQLVVLMKGEIEVESQLQKGTTFQIKLPYKQAIQNRSSNFPTEIYTDNKLETILIVEDNKDLIYYVSQIINSSYNILTANQATSGIEIAKQEIPDLIITDVMMPGMSGMQMTNILKQNDLTSHIPIIMLTAKTDHQSKLQGLDLGATAYITKPFEEKELLLRIKSIFENRARLQSHLLREIEKPDFIVADPFLEQVIQSINQNLDNNVFDVNQLCNEVNVQRSQLYKKVKSLTSKTPLELITEIRLNEATKLLRNPNIRINEVAFSCGFSDSNYFSKVFKKHLGMTPREYARKISAA